MLFLNLAILNTVLASAVHARLTGESFWLEAVIYVAVLLCILWRSRAEKFLGAFAGVMLIHLTASVLFLALTSETWFHFKTFMLWFSMQMLIVLPSYEATLHEVRKIIAAGYGAEAGMKAYKRGL